MSTDAEGRNSRLWSHRLTAHRMHERGSSHDAIAEYLRVSKRSVMRYLAVPRPAAPPPEREVALDSFFMDGACGSFPEYDWMSRSPLMQQECKAICAYCPVLARCREYGLGAGLDEVGVWGGRTRAERLTERRRRVTGGVLARQLGSVPVAESWGAA